MGWLDDRRARRASARLQEHRALAESLRATGAERWERFLAGDNSVWGGTRLIDDSRGFDDARTRFWTEHVVALSQRIGCAPELVAVRLMGRVVTSPRGTLLFPEADERTERERLERLRDLDAEVEAGRAVILVTDWRSAEEAAASWMRNSGWPDAKVTARGADAGIDVVAETAAAQVKWFVKGKVGRPAIQNLCGAAGERDCLFFANAGAGAGIPFTGQAIEWAKANSVGLLRIDAFGLVEWIRRPDWAEE